MILFEVCLFFIGGGGGGEGLEIHQWFVYLFDSTCTMVTID